MAFLVSPGVHVREIDLTNVIPAVSTSIGAIAGPFQKGPVSEVVNISSEEELITTFGKPNSSNFEWWFTAANFLQYGDALKVVRAESGLTKSSLSYSSRPIESREGPFLRRCSFITYLRSRPILVWK